MAYKKGEVVQVCSWYPLVHLDSKGIAHLWDAYSEKLSKRLSMIASREAIEAGKFGAIHYMKETSTLEIKSYIKITSLWDTLIVGVSPCDTSLDVALGVRWEKKIVMAGKSMSLLVSKCCYIYKNILNRERGCLSIRGKG